jgi:transcription initiation factor TFIID subunit 7
LKADNEAESTSYEIITPHSHPATRDNSLAPSDFGSPYPHSTGDDDLFEEGEEGSGEEEDADFADELEREIQEQGEAETPVPTPGATEQAEEESEESESEGDGVAGEGDEEVAMLKARREGEIQELEETIFQKRIAVAGIANPIVRGRMMEGLGRLESELMLKKRQLEEDEEEG